MHEHVVYKISLSYEGFVAACGRPPEPLVVAAELIPKREEVRRSLPLLTLSLFPFNLNLTIESIELMGKFLLLILTLSLMLSV